jgi:hypothetical protein
MGGVSTFGYVNQTPLLWFDFSGLARGRIFEFYSERYLSSTYLDRFPGFEKYRSTTSTFRIITAELSYCRLAGVIRGKARHSYGSSTYLGDNGANFIDRWAEWTVATTYKYVPFDHVAASYSCGDLFGPTTCTITDWRTETNSLFSEKEFPNPPTPPQGPKDGKGGSTP